MKLNNLTEEPFWCSEFGFLTCMQTCSDCELFYCEHNPSYEEDESVEMYSLMCWHCDHEWEHEITGKYPNGPCPVECPTCEEHCCPKCGGKIDNHGCCRCDYMHCGGCL
jgi:hypothetical protein